MKEEKSKEPRAAQTLLGIEWEINHKEILASPGERRVARLTEVIDGYLEKGRMSSSECSQLTGKLCFTCTWVFSNIGRAMLQPLYYRQHNGPPGSSPLTPRLRQALCQLRSLLPRLRPRRFALLSTERNRPVVHLYAGAFVTLHGVRRTANKWLKDLPPLQELSQSTNGFGALVAIPGRPPVGFRGEVPLEVLADLASSRAYIFWLEALAQVLSLATVCDLFDAHVCCWVDNTAAEHALNKGYSKDLRLSAIIGAFWVWTTSRSLSVSFHRVPSLENISGGISRGDLQETTSGRGDFSRGFLPGSVADTSAVRGRLQELRRRVRFSWSPLCRRSFTSALKGGFTAR